MQLESIDGNNVSIKGNIKTFADYNEIKTHIQKLVNSGINNLILQILDSYTITSSVIGYLFKLKNLNKITIHLHVRDERLYKILEELKLIEEFNVKKI